jgi:hypothetical protein
MKYQYLQYILLTFSPENFFILWIHTPFDQRMLNTL